MRKWDVINLISESYTIDAYGNQIATETAQQVYCEVEDISRAEFFASGSTGLHPSYTFVVFAGDYAGEKLAEYNGVTYAVYRTYHRNIDKVELYVTERVGVSNGGA